MSLKFDKVGHSTYVLYDDMCLGRIKKRYDGKVHFEIFKQDYPLSMSQVFDILQKMEELDVA